MTEVIVHPTQRGTAHQEINMLQRKHPDTIAEKHRHAGRAGEADVPPIMEFLEPRVLLSAGFGLPASDGMTTDGAASGMPGAISQQVVPPSGQTYSTARLVVTSDDDGQNGRTVTLQASGIPDGSYNDLTVLLYCKTDIFYRQPNVGSQLAIDFTGKATAEGVKPGKIWAWLVTKSFAAGVDDFAVKPPFAPDGQSVLAFAHSLNFDNETFNVKYSNNEPVGPGGNIFGDGSYVGQNGALHQTIVNTGGVWQCSETWLPAVATYGRYTFYINALSAPLDGSVVFGAFLYADNPLDDLKPFEIDMEIGAFGQSASHSQWTVQPNVPHTFATPLGDATYCYNWQPGEVEFSCWNGHNNAPASPTDIVDAFTYTGTDVPTEQEQLHLRLNLWLFNHQAPTNGQPAEIVVADVGLPASDAGKPEFAPEQNLALRYSPFYDTLACADYNGDGRIDFAGGTAWSESYAGAARVCLSNAQGTWQEQPSDLMAGSLMGVQDVRAADFNRDGRMDLAVIGEVEPAITLFRNLGKGSFAKQALTLSGAPRHIAWGDFNGDGYPDLAAGGWLSDNVEVVLNGPTGFGKENDFALQYNDSPCGIAVADLDGDGNQDIVTAGIYTDILFGRGDGTFEEPVRYESGHYDVDVVVADFTGDGRPDVVALPYSDTEFSLLRNDGHGHFADRTSMSVGAVLKSATVGDFDRDGHLDLVVATAESLLFLGGNGDGTFRPPAALDISGAPSYVTTADANGDSCPDIIFAKSNRAEIGVLYNQKSGPVVVSCTSWGEQDNAFDYVEIEFNEPIAESTLAPGLATLTGPAGTVACQSVSAVGGERYRLYFPPQDAHNQYTFTLLPQVTNLAGRALNQDGDDVDGEAVEDRFVGSVVPTVYPDPLIVGDGPGAQAKSVVFTDTNGSTVTVTLAKGTSELRFDNQPQLSPVAGGVLRLKGNLKLQQVDLTSTSASSVLTITAAGGTDGRTAVGAITGASPIGAINAPRVDLDGQGLLLTGSIGTVQNLTLGGLIGGADMKIAGTFHVGMRFALGQVSTGSEITVDQGPVASATFNGTFRGVFAAGVGPGPDGQWFTDDDAVLKEVSVGSVYFKPGATLDASVQQPYGLLLGPKAGVVYTGGAGKANGGRCADKQGFEAHILPGPNAALQNTSDRVIKGVRTVTGTATDVAFAYYKVLLYATVDIEYIQPWLGYSVMMNNRGGWSVRGVRSGTPQAYLVRWDYPIANSLLSPLVPDGINVIAASA
jgi:hypothetical protein